MKKHRALAKKKGQSVLRILENHPLPAYLALRRQKVRVGPLKTAADTDLEFYVCTPDTVAVED